jgi:hypothetical protein
MDFLRRCLDVLPTRRDVPIGDGFCCRRGGVPQFGANIQNGEIHVADLVEIAVPAIAQAAAEALGLKVRHSATNGAWVWGVPRDEAEMAVEYVRDDGFSACIRDCAAQNERRPCTLLRGPRRDASGDGDRAAESSFLDLNT